MIRKATPEDASRIAEIFIFAKRTAYRPIFNADEVSFNEMQVLPLALHYRDDPGALEGMYVYDDGIIRGLLHVKEEDGGVWKLDELYIDPFFQHMGYGKKLMETFLQWAREDGGRQAYLWVLEKNTAAQALYHSYGFQWDGTRQLEEGTPEYLLRLTRPL